MTSVFAPKARQTKPMPANKTYWAGVVDTGSGSYVAEASRGLTARQVRELVEDFLLPDELIFMNEYQLVIGEEE